jgi:uncharacterized protein (TIGR03067 family)
MKSQSLLLWICCALLVPLAAIAVEDDAKEKAIQKDRKLLEGKWRIVSLEINGNKAKDEDARKLTVLNGKDESWTLYSEGKEVAKGTNSFDPTQTPKTMDFTITEGGGKGNVHLGIYEIGENSRKICFAPPNKGRPTQFKSDQGSEHILVIFEREK